MPPGITAWFRRADPERVAQAILDWLLCESAGSLREHFLNPFTLECHLTNLAAAIPTLKPPKPTPVLQPAAQNPLPAKAHKFTTGNRARQLT